jgi:hypothetical protein
LISEFISNKHPSYFHVSVNPQKDPGSQPEKPDYTANPKRLSISLLKAGSFLLSIRKLVKRASSLKM